MGTWANYLYRPDYGEYGQANQQAFDTGLLSADSVLTSADNHINSQGIHANVYTEELTATNIQIRPSTTGLSALTIYSCAGAGATGHFLTKIVNEETASGDFNITAHSITNVLGRRNFVVKMGHNISKELYEVEGTEYSYSALGFESSYHPDAATDTNELYFEMAPSGSNPTVRRPWQCNYNAADDDFVNVFAARSHYFYDHNRTPAPVPAAGNLLMEITSAGWVGVGCTPLTNLMIQASTVYEGFKLYNGSTYIVVFSGFAVGNDNGTIQLLNVGNENVRLTAYGDSFIASGGLGIGTKTVGGNALGVNGQIGATTVTATTIHSTTLTANMAQSTSATFGTDFSISGLVTLNTNVPGYGLYINDTSDSTSHSLAIVNGGRSAGGFINCYHYGSAMGGTSVGLIMNMGNGGGSFGGLYAQFISGGVTKFQVNYDGVVYTTAYYQGPIFLAQDNAPEFRQIDSDANANEKIWSTFADAGVLYYKAVADNYSDAETYLAVGRSAHKIIQTNFPSGIVTIAGCGMVGSSVAPSTTLAVSGGPTSAFTIVNSGTPANSGDTGVQGTVAWDNTYIYICTDTNKWKRAAIAGW